MRINQANLRVHAFWVVACLAGTLLALAGMEVQWRPLRLSAPGGSSLWGLGCGAAAGLLILFECFLWPRKHLLRTWRIGRMRTWMSAHIWLGLLTLPLVLVHAGWPWRGSLAFWLMILYLLVMVSGLFGLWMQQWLPRAMMESTPQETIYAQIDVVASRTLDDADALVTAVCGGPPFGCPITRQGPRETVGATREAILVRERSWAMPLPTEPIANTESLRQAYQATIRPHLEESSGAEPLRNAREASIFFAELRSRTSPAAAEAIGRLESWCEQRRQFVRQAKLHFWLHSWLSIHAPLSFALLILLAWHIVVGLKYSGVYSWN